MAGNTLKPLNGCGCLEPVILEMLTIYKAVGTLEGDALGVKVGHARLPAVAQNLRKTRCFEFI